ncbi:MAG: hypothetical protein ABI477_07990, partial [Chryseolinea sp.]
QQVLSPKSHDIQAFHKICHKIKPTLVMLDDSEMLEIIEQLKIITNHTQLDLLDKICKGIIESLSKA